jgi:hypothetical protein
VGGDEGRKRRIERRGQTGAKCPLACAGHRNQRGQAARRQRAARGAGIWAARGKKRSLSEAAAAALRRREAWVAMKGG